METNKHLTFHRQVNQDISLTELRLSDVDSLIKHINDIDVYNNTLTIPYPYTELDAHTYIDICRKTEDRLGRIANYAIRKEGELIGGIGILYNHGADSHKSEFGYWISRYHRRQGYMLEVIHSFADMIVTDTNICRLEANVFVPNIASQKLLEKAGFKKEGMLKASFIKENKLVDTILYSKVFAG